MTRSTPTTGCVLVLLAMLQQPGAAQQRVPAPDSAPSASTAPGILVLSLDDPDQGYVRDRQLGFQQAIDASDTPAVVYREFVDQIRFGNDPSYAADLRAWLHRKYRDRPIGVIVVVEQSSLALIRQAPDNPWNDVPVVSGSLGDLTIDIRESHPTASRVIMENYLPYILETIRTILPGTRRIAAIQGSSAAERARDAWWLPQIREHGFEVLSLAGLTAEQLRERVSDLPDDTVPLVLSFQTDAVGRTFRANQHIRMILAAANRPLFLLHWPDEVDGLLGGAIPDFAAAGRALGTHTLGRLHGAAPHVEHLPASTFLRFVFDGHQLARWSIPEARLPPGSIVRNRPPSLWRDYRGTVVTTATTGAVLVLLLAVVLVERRNRAQAQAALRSSYTKLQDVTDRLMTAQEEERARIARDLHDDIGQRVASLSIALSRLKRELPPGPENGATPLVSDLQRETRRLSDDLRQLSHDLHPGALEHLGLVQAIRARCNEFREESGIPVRVEVADDWRDVPGAVALCLYRVTQEALRNVAAHAHAHNVVVALSSHNGHRTLRVSDDGRGFDQKAAGRSGLGLVSLGERVRMLGGRLDVTTGRGTGTILAVTLPAGAGDATESAAG